MLARPLLLLLPSAWVEGVKRDLAARIEPNREILAARYLRGEGIEIGARCHPLRVPPGARVRHVDNLTPEEMKRDYAAALEGTPVEPDVIDDAQRLAKFEDGSLDFIIANHLLEHLEDPIGALKHFFRVLRPGGILFLSIPDKERTFDRERAATTLEHLVRDHREGPEGSRREHYEESARFTPGRRTEAQIRGVAERWMSEGRSIHFHCWRQWDMFALFAHLRNAENVPFAVEAFQRHHRECLFVLRKAGPEAGESQRLSAEENGRAEAGSSLDSEPV
jgi:SAM-dependent methyltransferase